MAAVNNHLPDISNVRKLTKGKLVSTLKKCGLKSDVTVKEGQKLLRKFLHSNRNKQVEESFFEMDETESVCFVCDKHISSENWKYKLLETASKKRNVPVADLIKQLVGSEFAVLVGERDVVCSTCMNLLNLMDALTAQLKLVETTLSKHLYSKYGLESESAKFQVEYDDSTADKLEPLHKCSTCLFETKYEKEYNKHIRTHIIEKSTIKKTPAKSKVPSLKVSSPKVSSPKVSSPKVSIPKPVSNKRNVKSRAPKRVPVSNIKAVTKKIKPKDIVKKRESKVLYQCSVCNKMFPNESSVRTHAKKAHDNENIIISEENEYEDIQTLESSDEENSQINDKTNVEEIDTKVNSSLDFLDDWNDEEDSNDIKNSNTAKRLLNKASFSKIEVNHDDFSEDDESSDEQDQSSNPTCLFCNAKFSSFESVQDHVTMVHSVRTSNLKIGLKTTPPLGSFEIDSTTDIIEKKPHIKTGPKNSSSKRKSFKCNICGIKKVSLKFIKKHIRAHKKKMALKCRFCGISFKNIVAIKTHRYRCHKVAVIKKKCILCKMIFCDIKQLKTHVKKVHCKPMISKQKKKLTVIEHDTTSNYALRKNVDSLKLPHNLQTPSNKKVAKKSSQFTHDNSKISSSEVSSTSLENGTRQPPSTRKKYTCPLCNFVSNSDLEMKGHVKKHNFEESGNTRKILTIKKRKEDKNSSKLKCTECDIYVSEPRQLVNHMNRHKANTCHDLGICFYCNKLFLEKEQLTIHLNIIHDFKNDPVCPVCEKVYAHCKDLKLHFLRSHFSTRTENLIKQVSEELLNSSTLTNNSGFTEANDVYSKVFKELQDLTGEGNEDMSIDLPSSSLIYSCPLCGFEDCKKEVIEKHLPSHPQNYCNICKTLFNTEEAIKHIENHCIEFQNKQCPDCEVMFHDSLHLQCHTLRIHSSGKKMYKCSMCEKYFFSEKCLTAHKETMHGKSSKKVFSCNKCEMIFHTEKEFETHTEFAHRVVLNCKYCDKTLNDMNKLVLHEKNHLKQVKRIYKCNTCGKVVKTLSALKVHKTIHNHNVPLRCELCNLTFKSFHSMREHSAKHSGIQEKRFSCSVCGKGFYFYDSHYRHRKIHLDPLLFKCNTCGERFPSKLKRLEHIDICSASTQFSQ